MSTFKIFAKGLRTAIRKMRLVFYLWLATVLFSLVITAPVYFLLAKDYSRSLAGDWLYNGPTLLWLGDVIYKYKDVSPPLVGWVVVPAFLFLVLLVFLNGGLLGRISVNERVNLPAFLGDGTRYFWRLFRVFFLTLLGYVLVLGILGRAFSALFEIWMKNASSEWSILTASLLKLLVFLLLYSVVKMFFDYVKVRLVVTESRKSLRAVVDNISFLGRRFFRAWGLFLLCGLVFVGLTILFWLGSRLLPAGGIFSLGLLFLWHQAYILGMSWVIVLFFSTAYEFFKVHQYEPADPFSPSR